MEDFARKPFNLKILRSGWHITGPQAQQTKDFIESISKKISIYSASLSELGRNSLAPLEYKVL
jgi:hypothetical protein